MADPHNTANEYSDNKAPPPFVKVGSSVVIRTNVIFSSEKTHLGADATVIENNVTIAEGAIIYRGITVGAGSRISPGSVVTRSVPPRAIVEGNPATIIGYTDTYKEAMLDTAKVQIARSVDLKVKGVQLVDMKVVPDLRGNLTVGEFENNIPFTPRRYFMVYGVPSREVRGEHAHHQCKQFLICARGSCSVVVDDGQIRSEVLLDGPNIGLYIPPLTWGIQYKYTIDALLLVFASHHYDNSDYIRDYSEFLRVSAKQDL